MEDRGGGKGRGKTKDQLAHQEAEPPSPDSRFGEGSSAGTSQSRKGEPRQSTLRSIPAYTGEKSRKASASIHPRLWTCSRR